MSRAVILVNGVSGQLGSAIQRMTQFAPDDVKSRFVFLTREQMDLSNPDSVAMALNQHKPTMIVNCAAYVAVDKAEDERELATRVNVDAVAQMAEWAKKNQSDRKSVV